MVKAPVRASLRNIVGIVAEAHIHSSMASRWPETSVFQASTKHRSNLPRAPSRPSKQLVISRNLSYQSEDGAVF